MTDLNSMSLRELFTLRDTRVKRYEKERKQVEDEQKRREQEAIKARAAQASQNIRRSIVKK